MRTPHSFVVLALLLSSIAGDIDRRHSAANATLQYDGDSLLSRREKPYI
jgi:hypothetical protein